MGNSNSSNRAFIRSFHTLKKENVENLCRLWPWVVALHNNDYILNVYTNLDDSRVRLEIVFQVSKSLSQRSSNPQSKKNESEINRNYYQQLLDITLLKEIDKQLIKLESFYQNKMKKSIRFACDNLIITLIAFRRKFNKNGKYLKLIYWLNVLKQYTIWIFSDAESFWTASSDTMNELSNNASEKASDAQGPLFNDDQKRKAIAQSLPLVKRRRQRKQRQQSSVATSAHICKHCEKPYSNQNNLKRHIQMNHRPSSWFHFKKRKGVERNWTIR